MAALFLAGMVSGTAEAQRVSAMVNLPGISVGVNTPSVLLQTKGIRVGASGLSQACCHAKSESSADEGNGNV